MSERSRCALSTRSGRSGKETWSDDAVEESAVYCDGSQQYYASKAIDSGRTVDGDTVCDTRAELSGYWSDDDGFWRYGDADEDDDDDDDDDDCPIPPYHDAHRGRRSEFILKRLARLGMSLVF